MGGASSWTALFTSSSACLSVGILILDIPSLHCFRIIMVLCKSRYIHKGIDLMFGKERRNRFLLQKPKKPIAPQAHLLYSKQEYFMKITKNN